MVNVTFSPSVNIYDEAGLLIMQVPCMVGDWDVAELPGHKTKLCITVSSRQEAYRKISGFCRENPDHLFLVYDTPGGVRAFCVSHEYQPGTYESWSAQSRLGVDPLFQEFCWKKKAFTARVSPKPGRQGDYVAVKRYRVGRGQPLPHLIEAVQMHDQCIKEVLTAA